MNTLTHDNDKLSALMLNQNKFPSEYSKQFEYLEKIEKTFQQAFKLQNQFDTANPFIKAFQNASPAIEAISAAYENSGLKQLETLKSFMPKHTNTTFQWLEKTYNSPMNKIIRDMQAMTSSQNHLQVNKRAQYGETLLDLPIGKYARLAKEDNDKESDNNFNTLKQFIIGNAQKIENITITIVSGNGNKIVINANNSNLNL